MIVFVMLAAAVGCLIAGLLTNVLVLDWSALGLCGLGLVVLAAAVVARRRAAAGTADSGETADSDDQAADTDGATDPDSAEDPASVDVGEPAADAGVTVDGDTEVAAEALPSTPPAGTPVADGAGDLPKPVTTRTKRTRERRRVVAVSGDAAAKTVVPVTSELVYVVPGRRRYHRQGCRVLAANPGTAITVADAVDEEFSPCTVCMPHEARTA